MSIGVAYNPCKSCKEMDKCSICELSYYRKGCIKSPVSEVAREIFEEIEEILKRLYHSNKISLYDRALTIANKHSARHSIVTLKRDIDELKKKYTEV